MTIKDFSDLFSKINSHLEPSAKVAIPYVAALLFIGFRLLRKNRKATS